MTRLHIKICCISTLSEAKIAIDAGADAIGLVGPMPSGPGTISLSHATNIALETSPPVSRFLLSSADQAEALIEQAIKTGVDTLQIVRQLDPSVLKKVRQAMPAIRLVQVVHVLSRADLDVIASHGPHVHAFLLDSGRPDAPVAELGGTGRVHDWSISNEFVENSPVPVFLAGGLNADNVGEAIGTVRPYGVDLCSGVRTGGGLDPIKLEKFMSAVRGAERVME
jgi:phosphoribosylanthranilate isomerase